MVDAVDEGFALRHQAGDDEAGGGAQVGGHHRGAVELGHALDHGGVAVDPDVGAEADQFDGMHETVLEDGLADHGGAFGDGVDGHELRLHVGREGRIGRGADRDRAQAARRLEADGVAGEFDLAARVHEFVDDGVKVGGGRAGKAHLAARGGGGA